jgi:hypothetical protein
MTLKIILFFCLCLVVKNSGGFAWYSPAMGVAFLVNIILILITFTKCNAKITKYSLGVSFLIFLILLISVISEETLRGLLNRGGRLIYLTACLSLSTYLPSKGNKTISFLFLGLVILDLFYRFVTAQSYTLYGGLKDGLFFIDTNFVALIFMCYLIPIMKKVSKLNLLFYFMLLLSFLSRTGLAVFLVSYLSKRVALITIICIVGAFSYLTFWEASTLPQILKDGSLLTKFLILKTSIAIASTDPSALFWGYGKIGVATAVEGLTMHNGKGYTVGHTLPGLIIELGIIYLSAYFILVNQFIVRGYRIVFWISMCFAGFIGLFPISYLGICVILYNNSIYSLIPRKEVSTDYER